jgi:hypothetical protein
LNDFFDQNMLQVYDFARILFDRTIPFGRKARYTAGGSFGRERPKSSASSFSSISAGEWSPDGGKDDAFRMVSFTSGADASSAILRAPAVVERSERSSSPETDRGADGRRPAVGPDDPASGARTDIAGAALVTGGSDGREAPLRAPPPLSRNDDVPAIFSPEETDDTAGADKDTEDGEACGNEEGADTDGELRPPDAGRSL